MFTNVSPRFSEIFSEASHLNNHSKEFEKIFIRCDLGKTDGKSIVKNIQKNQDSELCKEEYETTIKVKVPKKEDKVFITGNQTNLGDWNPKKLEMKRISDYEREIILKLKSPAQFKFTRGSWDSEAEVIGTYGNITIRPEKQTNFDFKIENYFDKQ